MRQPIGQQLSTPDKKNGSDLNSTAVLLLFLENALSILDRRALRTHVLMAFDAGLHGVEPL